MNNVLFLHECDYRNLMKKAGEDKVQYCTLQRLARYRNLPLISVPKGDKMSYTFIKGPEDCPLQEPRMVDFPELPESFGPCGPLSVDVCGSGLFHFFQISVSL